MDITDRRNFLKMSLGGFAAATVAAASIATVASVVPTTADAMPLADKSLKAVDPVEKAQVVVSGSRSSRHWDDRRRRHRRRRWVCWWHRGRRICGWRWV